MTNYRVNTTDELYHHGVLGQRWGVRRYQNKDGSRIKGAASRFYKSGALDKTINNTRNATDNGKRITSGVKKLKTDKHTDLSSMSDAELRATVNRLNLERQYTQLINSNKKVGTDYVDGLLDIIGGVAGITGSVVGTIALIRSIR